jgi:glucose/arabinose dehydrogenase
VVGAAAFLLASVAWLGGAPTGVSPARAAVTPALPAGFTDETIVTGLDLPTVIAIAPTGRVFVGQKGGVIKTWSTYAAFASNGVPTQTIDLSTDVYNYWDRGLMGLAIDPAYPASPYIYVLYTYDAPPGKSAPLLG